MHAKTEKKNKLHSTLLVLGTIGWIICIQVLLLLLCSLSVAQVVLVLYMAIFATETDDYYGHQTKGWSLPDLLVVLISLVLFFLIFFGGCYALYKSRMNQKLYVYLLKLF
jgi:hypothetical protein